jgi:hypothetical protein
VSWHIILSRRDDSTMPMTQWPQQSQPFQPCSIGREKRRRRNLRRMRHAVIPIVSFHSRCQWSNPHASKLHRDHVACFKRLWCRTFEVWTAPFRTAPTARAERRADLANMLSTICLSWRLIRRGDGSSIGWRE